LKPPFEGSSAGGLPVPAFCPILACGGILWILTLDAEKSAPADIEPAPEELAAGDANLTAGEPCPLCEQRRDPLTGELRFNAETVAAIEEGRAMMRGEIPSRLYHSFEELWADLEADDDEEA
jgi:hypothetical protein